jgi:two-component system sensor histidine kinase YesM
MKTNLRTRFNDLSIKYKLLISYLLLITLLLGLFLAVNTLLTSRETQKQALFSARQLLNQTKSYLEYKTQTVGNTLNIIAFNDTVRKIITHSPETYYQDIGLWNVNTTKLSRVFFTTKNNTDIATIHLYMKQSLALVFQNKDFLNLNLVTATPWYRILITSPDLIHWYPQQYFAPSEQGDLVYALRNITSEQNFSESIGVIKADVPKQTFRLILDKAIFTKSTAAILINQNREIICTSGNSRLVNPRALAGILDECETVNFETGFWNSLKYNHHQVLVGIRNINHSDWRLLIIIPYHDIVMLSVKSNQRMLLVFLVITLLTVPVAFFIAGTATSRLYRLAQQMRQVESGEFVLSKPSGGNDEIGRLTKNFNFMLTKITVLLEEKYRLGQEIKNLELKALQAQINPHFLYNTLDLINWMAVKTKTPEISRVVKALSRFYRLSLNKGEETMSIHDEIEHVRAYVEIQNMRFNNCIRFETALPNEILEHKILKLILQPLVENSILHGILEKEIEAGTIRIYGKIEDGIIQLYVEDDGVGLSAEQTAQMLTDNSAENTHGYGVKNIHQRLQLNYGPEFGLTYYSEPDRGTTVMIKIPINR